jgi:hypothetical protein
MEGIPIVTVGDTRCAAPAESAILQLREEPAPCALSLHEQVLTPHLPKKVMVPNVLKVFM